MPNVHTSVVIFPLRSLDEELTFRVDAQLESFIDVELERYYNLVNWADLERAFALNHATLMLDFANIDVAKVENFPTGNKILAVMPLNQLEKLHEGLFDTLEFRKAVKKECTSYDGYASFYSSNTTHSDWTCPVDQWTEAQRSLLVSVYLNNIEAYENTYVDVDFEIPSWEKVVEQTVALNLSNKSMDLNQFCRSHDLTKEDIHNTLPNPHFHITKPEYNLVRK